MEVAQHRTMLCARRLWISWYRMKGHSKWDNIKDTKVILRIIFMENILYDIVWYDVTY